MTELLRLTGVTRTYGGLAAVDHVDFALSGGTRHAIIGPNGAGKTTLLGLIAGTVRPTAGHIALAEHDITRSGPSRRSRLGIARSFQQPTVVTEVSVLDNVVLAAWRHSPVRAVWRPSRHRQLGELCRQHLAAVGLADLAGSPAGALSHGQRRLLDIATALAADPRLLLLDEPAAGLTEADIDRLLIVLRQLPDTVTVLLVEHNIDVVTAVANAVTVLHTGRVLCTGTPAEVQADPQVRQAYLGTSEAVG